MSALTAAADTTLAKPANDTTGQPINGDSTVMEGDAGWPASLRLNAHAVIFSLATILALATAAECRSITYLPSLQYGAVHWLWWGCLASGMWRLSKRLRFASSFSPRAISIQLFVGSVLGVAHLMLLGSLGFTDPGWPTHASALAIWTSMLTINRFGMEVLLYGFLFGMIGVVQFQIRAQQDALKSIELQKQLSTAHLRALQMQMEPHFLFNTLNAITTLVEFGRQKEDALSPQRNSAEHIAENDSGEGSALAGVGDDGELSGYRTGSLCRPAPHRDQSRGGRPGRARPMLSASADRGKRHPAWDCQL